VPVPVPARRGALTEPDNEVGVRESVRVRMRGTGLAHADVNGRGEPRLRALAGAVFSLELFSLRERGKDTCTGTCLESHLRRALSSSLGRQQSYEEYL
jgi:hypothetical protein